MLISMPNLYKYTHNTRVAVDSSQNGQYLRPQRNGAVSNFQSQKKCNFS